MEGRDGSRAAVELTGNLPCVRCKYNLRGLSIRGICPECGTTVRATLLAVVDPLASELRPITHPRGTAIGILAWSFGALAAGVTLGIWRIIDLQAGGLVPIGRERVVGLIAVACVVVSWAGAIAFVRPHAGLPARGIALAKFGVMAYAPLVAVLYWIHCVIDPAIGSPYGGGDVASVARILLRILAAGLIAASLLSLRPNARVLAARSLLMRTGRVDRQTMRALASALLVPLLGDLVQLGAVFSAGPVSEVLNTVGGFLILIGSALFLFGLVNVCIDAVRLAPVVAAPPLSLAEITTPGTGGA